MIVVGLMILAIRVLIVLSSNLIELCRLGYRILEK